MSETLTLSHGVLSWSVTYLLHSTLLLCGCWCVLTVRRCRSHFLRERMWKLAAILGLLTAALQVAAGPVALPGLHRLAERSPQESSVSVTHTPELWPRDFGQPPALGDSSPASLPTAAGQSLQSESGESISEAAAVQGHWSPSDAVPWAGIETETIAASPAAPPVDQAELVLPASQPIGNAEIESATGDRQVWRRLRAWLATTAAWLVIASVSLGGCLLVIQSARLRARFSQATVLREGAARRILDRFLKRHKIRRSVLLLSSTKQSEPIAYGVFVWTIMLPAQTEQRLSNEELKALVAHEVAHLARGDVWWLWIGRVLCSCLAFQPLNWLARREWQQASEYLCDDWAVARGVPSMSLARCLTRVAEWRCGPQPLAGGLAAGGSKGTLVKRVERLVKGSVRSDPWSGPLRRRVLSVAAGFVVIAITGFVPPVAMPLSLSSVDPASLCDLGSDAAGASARDEWLTLEEELLQLEADLQRVDELAASLPRDPVVKLNQRMAVLQARRQRIASFFEEESKR